jgi:hypothetical protein
VTLTCINLAASGGFPLQDTHVPSAAPVNVPSPAPDAPAAAAPAPDKDDHSDQDAHAVAQVGVGIFFEKNDDDGFVFVRSIVKGGSAERDGTVQVGDRILSVDDRSVAGESLAALRPLVIGPQGSAVKMKFSRQSSNGGAQDIIVSLIRSAQSAPSVAAVSPVNENPEIQIENHKKSFKEFTSGKYMTIKDLLAKSRSEVEVEIFCDFFDGIANEEMWCSVNGSAFFDAESPSLPPLCSAAQAGDVSAILSLTKDDKSKSFLNQADR